MKNTFIIFLLSIGFLQGYSQNGFDMGIIKPMVRINSFSDGYYNDIISDMFDSVYYGSLVKNLGDKTATGVFLEVTTLNNGITNVFYSDTVTLLPGMSDTLIIPSYSINSEMYSVLQINMEVHMDSIDQNPSNNYYQIPDVNIFGGGQFWANLSRTNYGELTLDSSLLPAFGTGDFLGIQFQVHSISPNYWPHMFYSLKIMSDKLSSDSVALSFVFYRNKKLMFSQNIDIDSVLYFDKFYNITTDFSNFYLSLIYPDSLYYIGIRLDSGSLSSLHLKVDTSQHHHFQSETVVFINDSLYQADFVPVFILICDPESIEETEKKEPLTVYPNPTTGLITVKTERGKCWSIFNSKGEFLQKHSIFGNGFQLNLKAYPSGVYFLKVEEERKVYYKKIIKR